MFTIAIRCSIFVFNSFISAITTPDSPACPLAWKLQLQTTDLPQSFEDFLAKSTGSDVTPFVANITATTSMNESSVIIVSSPLTGFVRLTSILLIGNRDIT